MTSPATNWLASNGDLNDFTFLQIVQLAFGGYGVVVLELTGRRFPFPAVHSGRVGAAMAFTPPVVSANNPGTITAK